jgi:hypothetical protein
MEEQTIGTQTPDIYESGKLIYPDCIAENVGSDIPEVPIKQYNVAKFSTWYRFEKAEGRLQVTNKRILFRATGKSPYGKTVIQNEFAIAEVGGFEIRKGTVFYASYLVMALLIFMVIISICGGFSAIPKATYDFFGNYSEPKRADTTVLSVIIVLLALGPVLYSKHRLATIIGLSLTALGVGLCRNATALSIEMIPVVIQILIFSNRPNIVITVKSKGAGTGVDIRRTSRVQKQEYTGFTCVLPWKDTDLAIMQLGSMIHDIQTQPAENFLKWQDEVAKQRTSQQAREILLGN